MAVNNVTADGETSIWDAVFYHCSQGATGTLFISCDNKAGQIVIHKGNLIAVGYNGCFSRTAAEQISALAMPRHAFTADLIFPLRETLLPDDAHALLNDMGYSRYLLHSLAESATDQSAGEQDDVNGTATEDTLTPDTVPDADTAKRIYRGQVLMSTNQTTTPHHSEKRSVRMYRGQPVL